MSNPRRNNLHFDCLESAYAFKLGGTSDMKRGNLAMTALALGAAYLMRNGKAREKLKNQFQALGGPSKRRS